MRRVCLTMLCAVAATSPLAASTPAMGPITITASNPHDQFEPAVAYDAEHPRYLAVWQQEDVSGVLQIVGRFVSVDGAPFGDSFFITTGSTNQTDPDVAYDPEHDRFHVVWVDDFNGDGTDHDIRGRYIPWDGPVAHLGDFAINDETTDQGHPSIVVAPAPVDQFFITWHTKDTGSPWIIEGQLWATDGSTSSPVLDVASDATLSRVNPEATYSATNGRFVVVYERFATLDEGDVYAANLSFSGTVLATDLGISGFPSDEHQADVVACGDSYLFVWSADGGNGYQVFARPASSDLTLGTTVNLSDPFVAQGNPAAACRPAARDFLVVWEFEATSNFHGIAGELVDPASRSYGSFNVRFVEGTEERDHTRPAVATGAGRALAIWESDRADLTFKDVAGRWIQLDLFSDGFESGNATEWSAVTN